jgi:DNA-directed RNA polymerase subunit alpha
MQGLVSKEWDIIDDYTALCPKETGASKAHDFFEKKSLDTQLPWVCWIYSTDRWHARCKRCACSFHGYLFHQGGNLMAKTRIPLSAQEEQARSLNERLDLSTAEIGLTVRTTNCLEERGIFTVRDLLNTRREDLLSISNFGEKTLEEVYQALEQFGFYRPGRDKKPR